MNLSVIPISLNIHTQEAETAAIDWGWNFGIVDDEHILKSEKVLWLAGYALPDLDKFHLEEVTKFFFCLYTLDELLEDCTYEDAMEFFHRWEEYLFYQDFESPFSSLWYALDNALEKMETFSDQEWRDTLWFYLDDYMQARRWEYCNVKEGIIPGMNLFIMQRSYSSGIYLASHFLKLNYPAEEYPILWVEQRVARIICLSSDLKAFQFHRKTQNNHNELVLRQLHTGVSDAEIIRHALNSLSLLFKNLIEMIQELTNNNKSLTTWTDQLMLLLGGYLYWSEENTLRYGTTVNGINKT
ncbi:hypothetical protein FHS59_003485 [Algoriphagus iocasae]|uniref:Terpene synthase n=1 Tax=Algoriphagus iocasae TaxID=1836499 RepID=A0A841MHU2_9BACT|nr:hypothetical protein [Algoriphagus iocasae]MBB6327842.1 hypothetical protein [Algoriphagus iocasae]